MSGLRVGSVFQVEGPLKNTSAKVRIGISHVTPLIVKPNKVGISL